ncbi:hypothetical protein AGMMS50225_24380 [Betaproteobacteria bacterium]|nr:hypothetical protein AGMMS50225_24380 [Betaproteobacteria bacterium]
MPLSPHTSWPVQNANARFSELPAANLVPELRKSRPQGTVRARIKAIPDIELHLSAVTLGEIQANVEVTCTQNLAKAAKIEAWIDRVVAVYNVLSRDAKTFRPWAQLMFCQPDIVSEDTMIAVCVIQHYLTVSTRNMRGFANFQILLINPFATQS